MRILLLSSLALCLAACSGDRHLSPRHGESYTRAFAAQQQRLARPAEAVIGLDAQEAAITTDNYRATLAAKGKEARSEPTVIVAPPQREMPVPLAPSVPRE